MSSLQSAAPYPVSCLVLTPADHDELSARWYGLAAGAGCATVSSAKCEGRAPAVMLQPGKPASVLPCASAGALAVLTVSALRWSDVAGLYVS